MTYEQAKAITDNNDAHVETINKQALEILELKYRLKTMDRELKTTREILKDCQAHDKHYLDK